FTALAPRSSPRIRCAILTPPASARGGPAPRPAPPAAPSRPPPPPPSRWGLPPPSPPAGAGRRGRGRGRSVGGSFAPLPSRFPLVFTPAPSTSAPNSLGVIDRSPPRVRSITV